MVNWVGFRAGLTDLIEPDDDLALLVAIRTIEQKAFNLVLGLGSRWFLTPCCRMKAKNVCQRTNSLDFLKM